MSIIDQYIEVSDEDVADAKKCIISRPLPTDDEIRKLMISGRRTRLRTAWSRICPASYDETDVDKIMPQKIRSVFSAYDSGSGVYAYGKVGTYKSRVMYLLLAREFVKGRSVCVINGYEMPSLLRGTSESLSQRVATATEADVLYLDDLFKAKLSEAQETLIFEIVEKRCANKKLVLVTSNATLKHDTKGELPYIGGFFSDSGQAIRGPAIVRRLQESCRIIRFS